MARGKRKDTTEAGDATDAGQARDERAAEAQERRSNSAKSKKEVAAAHERLNRLENVLETAKAKVKQAYADLKEQGFNLKAFKRARKDLREDPLDAQMELDDYLAYRELLGAGEAVEEARQAEDREANEASVRAAMSTGDSLAKAAAAGLEAGKAARDRTSNPHTEGSPEFLAWDANWLAGQRQNISAAADAERAAEPAAA
mgnify:CR=1 FL=1